MTHPDPYTIIPAVLHPVDAEDHFDRWLAHVEAGRIGGNPPTPPAVAAIRDANVALFDRLLSRR